jgi:hypothetical protein
MKASAASAARWTAAPVRRGFTTEHTESTETEENVGRPSVCVAGQGHARHIYELSNQISFEVPPGYPRESSLWSSCPPCAPW